MNIINIKLGVDTQPCSSITLGRRGENEVTQVVVDFSSWVEEFGAGVITLLAMRSQDTSAYPVVLTLDGNTATWDVTSTDTAYKGSGRAEYIYTVGEQIAKSVVFGTTVLQDIGEPSETPPDPYEDWLERLTELGAETQANAEAAEQSAENAAESAQEAAGSATSAEGYAGQAETAAGLAQAAQTASEAARDAAQTAQASAEASATAASGSAASAAGSATAAAGSASDASASATAAGASSTAASASATTASNAATAAQAAQSAAEDAAEDAQEAAQQAHVEYEQLSGEVDDLSDEVSQQKSAIEALDSLVDRKAGMLVDSVSGAVASFVPDSTIDNLLGVSVAVEPVQDLHGYDSPWPAGGGVNLFDIDNPFITAAAAGYITTYAPKVEDGKFYNGGKKGEASGASYTIPVEAGSTYTVQFVINGESANWEVRAVTLDGNVWTSNTVLANNQSAPLTGAVTVTVTIPSGKTHLFVACYSATKQGSWETNIQIEKGSTATAWVPFENICPISGWDSVIIPVTGVNVWDEEWERGGINDNTGEPNVSINSQFRSKNYIPCKGGASYFGYYNGSSSGGLYIYAYDRNKQFVGRVSSGGVNNVAKKVVTVPGNAAFLMFKCQPGTPIASNDKTACINYPSTDRAYHPYSGNRYTIQLGQTVYGGTLTIAEDGSVTALVDRAKRHFSGGNDAWVVGVGAGVNCNRAAFQFSDALLGSNNGIVSDVFKSEIQSTPKLYHGMVNNNGSLLLGVPTTVADRAAMNSWAAENPFDIVYYIAPIEIQLDPVTISTISGQTNNVWADAGDVDVTFAADIKAYIDRLNQPTEDDMIANTLIAANKYFTVNNKLYLSTASIAAGAQIIPGTNCTETSLAAALNALNA